MARVCGRISMTSRNKANDVFFILLVLFTAYFPSLTGLKSSCEAPDATEGESAKVVCKFEDDVSKLQQDFQVLRYTDFVMKCAWISGKLDCSLKDGYRFDRKVTNQLIIEISNVKKENGGQYKCVVTPSESEEVSSCLLNVTRFVHMSTTTLIAERKPRDRIYYHEIPITLGAVLLLTTIVMLVLLLTKFSKRLDRCLKIRPQNIIYKKRNRDEKEWRPKLGAEGEDFLPPESGVRDEL